MKFPVTFLAVLALMVSVASAELIVLQDGRDGYTGAQDTTIYSGNDTNYGTHSNGAYQTHYIAWGGADYRSLFSWDVSSYAGSANGDATITLWRDSQNASQNNSVDFYGVTETWTEGAVNRPTRDGSNAWAGGAMLGTPGASASMTGLLDSTGATAGETSYDLTIPAATVDTWLASGFASVIGIMPGQTNSSWAWYTKDSNQAGVTQERKPKLTLDVNLIPEPATWTVLGLGSVLVLLRRRRT
jgi:hypothetical protein